MCFDNYNILQILCKNVSYAESDNDTILSLSNKNWHYLGSRSWQPSVLQSLSSYSRWARMRVWVDMVVMWTCHFILSLSLKKHMRTKEVAYGRFRSCDNVAWRKVMADWLAIKQPNESPSRRSALIRPPVWTLRVVASHLKDFCIRNSQPPFTLLGPEFASSQGMRVFSK